MQWTLKEALSEFAFFGRKLLVCIPAVCLVYVHSFPPFDSYLWPLRTAELVLCPDSG